MFSKQTVVDEDELMDPHTEITLEEARRDQPDAEVGAVIETVKDDIDAPLTRIAAQAAKQVIYQKVKEAEREIDLARVRRPHRRAADRAGQAIRSRRHDRRSGTNRGDRSRVASSRVPSTTTRAIASAPCWSTSSARGRARSCSCLGRASCSSRSCSRWRCRRSTTARSSIVERGARRRRAHARSPCARRTATSIRSARASGMKGSRVQAVIRELRGEKIDIVQYDDDPAQYVRHALNPASINRVAVRDYETREMEVIVSEDQLSLSIGKRGQNVRLASKLVGWKLGHQERGREEGRGRGRDGADGAGQPRARRACPASRRDGHGSCSTPDSAASRRSRWRRSRTSPGSTASTRTRRSRFTTRRSRRSKPSAPPRSFPRRPVTTHWTTWTAWIRRPAVGRLPRLTRRSTADVGSDGGGPGRGSFRSRHGKVRVYQLAKELKVQSALILELLDRLGQEVHSDLSTLIADDRDLVRQRVTRRSSRERRRLSEQATPVGTTRTPDSAVADAGEAAALEAQSAAHVESEETSEPAGIPHAPLSRLPSRHRRLRSGRRHRRPRPRRRRSPPRAADCSAAQAPASRATPWPRRVSGRDSRCLGRHGRPRRAEATSTPGASDPRTGHGVVATRVRAADPRRSPRRPPMPPGRRQARSWLRLRPTG